MNSERIASVADRARVYAALGDPGRLAIVDMLSVGDHSPTELRVALGMESNLLAHHLNVLEREHIVTRTRSEGDGRRSYIRLVPALPDQLAPVPVVSARRVAFVCTANAARSQLAQALWAEASNVPAVSAGTHPADQVAPGAIEVASRHDLGLVARSPRAVDDVVLVDDLVVTVCDRAHEEYPGSVHWSVPDPVRVGTTKAFDAAYEELADRVTRFAPRLEAVA